jgi:hypothetical protein
MLGVLCRLIGQNRSPLPPAITKAKIFEGFTAPIMIAGGIWVNWRSSTPAAPEEGLLLARQAGRWNRFHKSPGFFDLAICGKYGAVNGLLVGKQILRRNWGLNALEFEKRFDLGA